MQPKLLGVFIIAFGLILLLNNLGIMDVDIGDLVATYWPVLLIVWGIDSIRRRAGKNNFARGMLSGLILLILGTLLLGRNTGLYELDLSILWKLFWPLLVILVGWSLLRGTVNTSGGTHFAVMSGIELKNQGWKLEDGNFVAIMGGADLDLTVADIPDQEVELNLTAVMGGIDVRVPGNTTIECEGTAFVGGVNFLGEESGGIFASRKFRQKGDPESKKIVIKGTAVMGGVTVKH